MNNSAVITNVQSQLDTERLARYTNDRIALVAQGGGQRGIFTAGVLDAFLAEKFDPFHTFYGTSAGALNLCAFLCRQRGLGKAFITELTTDPQFFNLFSYIRRQQYLQLDWALDRIQHEPYRLDLVRGRAALGSRHAYAAVTHAQTLHDHYLPFMGNNWERVLRATCAIPRLCHEEVVVNEQPYVDGGVSASIPVQEAWRQGHRCIVVIRTESETSIVEPDEAKPEIRSLAPIEPLTHSLQRWLPTSWTEKLDRWQGDWRTRIQNRLHTQRDHTEQAESLNGGRWLFGADQIYRLSSLLGDKWDAGIADMLMVHYQTYALTQTFLSLPPDDCFVVQIMPESPLLSSSLLSKPAALRHDYMLGLRAGRRFIHHCAPLLSKHPCAAQ